MDVVFYEKIKQKGDVRIPQQIIKRLGLRGGEDIRFIVKNKHVFIEPAKDPIKALRGIVKLNKKTAKEIIESPEFEPI